MGEKSCLFSWKRSLFYPVVGGKGVERGGEGQAGTRKLKMSLSAWKIKGNSRGATVNARQGSSIERSGILSSRKKGRDQENCRPAALKEVNPLKKGLKGRRPKEGSKKGEGENMSCTTERTRGRILKIGGEGEGKKPRGNLSR